MFFKLCIVAALAVLVSRVDAKSDGAPLGSCPDLMPHHGDIKPQTSSAPYTVTIDKKAIRAGESIQITVAGKSEKHMIKGFMVQARDSNDSPVGTFKVSANDNFMKAIDCDGVKANTITHKKHPTNLDKKSFTVTWTPPKQYKGPIVVKATVVKNGEIFWVAIPSDTLNVA